MMKELYKSDPPGADNTSSLSGNIVFYQTIKDMPPAAVRVILDIGSGIGYKSLLLREIFPKAKVCSLELNTLVDMGYSDSPLRGNGVNLPFKRGTMDMVVCCEVLEHVDQPEKVIGEISRVLRQRGYLVLTSPNYGWNLAGLAKMILGKTTWNPWYGHVGKKENFTTAKILRALLSPGDYAIQSVYGEAGESLLNSFFPPWWLLNKYLSKRPRRKKYSPYALKEQVLRHKSLPLRVKGPVLSKMFLGYLILAIKR